MQKLHLVGYTADNDGLIFSARKGSKSGGYVVALDRKLVAKIEEAQRRLDDEDERSGHRRGPRPDSVLSPREMQARLRSGRTIAQVAREAAVDEDWVARFADPIHAEMARVINQARNLVFSKARLGPSIQPLGESVRWNAFDRGARMPDDVFDAAWSAYHLRDSDWVVRFAYTNRKKTQNAEWDLDIHEGVLASRNRLATELGYVEPGRRRRRQPPAVVVSDKPAEAPARRTPATKRAKKAATVRKARARKAGATKTAPKKAGSKRVAARKAPAKKAPARKAPAKRGAARRVSPRTASAKKVRARKAPARQVAARKAPAKRSAAKKVAARKAPAKRSAANRATKAPDRSPLVARTQTPPRITPVPTPEPPERVPFPERPRPVLPPVATLAESAGTETEGDGERPIIRLPRPSNIRRRPLRLR